MALVVVTGGTGTLGRHVVAELRPQHDVRVVSRRPGDGRIVADLAAGTGVAEALADADVVVHAASDPRTFGRTDEVQTRHLLDAVPASAHLVYVSIVGIDRIPFRYYRRKLDCERLIEASGQPHTIVRITQFHELIEMALTALERLPVVPLPTSFRFQSIAAAEAAGLVVQHALRPPCGRAPDAGGPQVLRLGDMAAIRQEARSWRQARTRPRRVLPVPFPGRVATGFRLGHNTVPGNPVGRQTWADYVRESTA